MATYINLINIVYYLNIANKKGKFIKKYFCYDLNKKYLLQNEIDVIEFAEYAKKNKNEFENGVNEMIKKVAKEIQNSKYVEKVEEILK